MPEVVFPSEWAKIGVNVKAGDSLRFVDVGTFDEEEERWNFKVEIYSNGLLTDTKKFNLNKTNFKIVSSLYGSNSDAWLGKDVLVNLIKVRNPMTGLLVDSIALSAPVSAPQPTAV